MRSRISVFGWATGALAASAVLAVSVATADAASTTYRIGTSVARGPHKPSPNPTPTASTTSSSPAPSPTTSTDTPSLAPTSSSAMPTTSSASPSPTQTVAPGSCSTGTLLKPDGSPWVCSFDDEFDGTTIDRSKWLVQQTATSGYHTGAECYVDSSNNLSVSGGVLSLTVRREGAPFTCQSPSGNYATQYTSGSVSGYGKFSQTYGRFEVRAKLPNTAIKGLQEALWLWPDNATKYGLWPKSGEIDFGEFYSQYSGWNIPYIHYYVLQSTVSWLTNTNVYTALPAPNNQPGMACSYDTTAFNTYTVLWEPGRITLQVNGQNCVINNYSAVGLTGAAPFDQPFFIALTQALGIGGNAFVDGVTPLPATTEVDYVRIWK